MKANTMPATDEHRALGQQVDPAREQQVPHHVDVAHQPDEQIAAVVALVLGVVEAVDVGEDVAADAHGRLPADDGDEELEPLGRESQQHRNGERCTGEQMMGPRSIGASASAAAVPAPGCRAEHCRRPGLCRDQMVDDPRDGPGRSSSSAWRPAPTAGPRRCGGVARQRRTEPRDGSSDVADGHPGRPASAGETGSSYPRRAPVASTVSIAATVATAAWYQVIDACARARPAAAETGSAIGIAEEACDGGGHRVVVVGGHDDARSRRRVMRHVALVGRHDRQAGGEVVDHLEGAEVEVVLGRVGGEPDGGARLIRALAAVRRQGACDLDTVADAAPGGGIPEGVGAAATTDHEEVRVVTVGGEIDQQAE
jgi:hypothetical protein